METESPVLYAQIVMTMAKDFSEASVFCYMTCSQVQSIKISASNSE